MVEPGNEPSLVASGLRRMSPRTKEVTYEPTTRCSRKRGPRDDAPRPIPEASSIQMAYVQFDGQKYVRSNRDSSHLFGSCIWTDDSVGRVMGVGDT